MYRVKQSKTLEKESNNEHNGCGGEDLCHGTRERKESSADTQDGDVAAHTSEVLMKRKKIHLTSFEAHLCLAALRSVIPRQLRVRTESPGKTRRWPETARILDMKTGFREKGDRAPSSS